MAERRRLFVTCVQRAKEVEGSEGGGIAFYGISDDPTKPPFAHKSRAEMLDDLHRGVEYYSAALGDELNEGRWTPLEIPFRLGEEIIKTIPSYDPEVYLSKKPRCKH